MSTTRLRGLQLSFLLLVFSTLSLAALPSFWVPQSTNPVIIDRLQYAWREAIFLARFASLSYQGKCNPSFQRFFENDGDPFVANIFRSIANIPLDATFDRDSAFQLLYSDAVTGLSPKFRTLRISLGEPPWVLEQYKGYCDEQESFGAFMQGCTSEDATIVVCPGIVTFPTLVEISSPPDWALDAQGRPKEGYTCDGLLGRDTEYMVSAGALILHELVHWAILFRDIPYWTTFIGEGQAARIVDYDGGEDGVPQDGDGPYNTWLLKQLTIQDPTVSDDHLTLNNADSYMWYALDVWWSWRCGRTFDAAQSEADSFLRTPAGAVTAGFPLPEGFQPVVQVADQPARGLPDFSVDGVF